MSEAKEKRERRISERVDDLVKKLTPGVEEMIEEMRASILKQRLPIDGRPLIGDLSRSQAMAYSDQFVRLAFMLNQAAQVLPSEAKPRRKIVPKGLSI
jgi:hypothetical protein